VQECARDRLLDADGRSSLQRAVARAWEHPIINGGNSVFISYSRKHEDTARELADGLRARGIRASLDRNELDRDASDAMVETWIAESLMGSVTSVYLISDEARSSGWVHREGEWQFRALGTKPSLVLPYIVVSGEARERMRYPRCRIIEAADLSNDRDRVMNHLAARVALDWLLMLRAGAEQRHFGIAYQGEPQVVELAVPENLTTTGSR